MESRNSGLPDYERSKDPKDENDVKADPVSTEVISPVKLDHEGKPALQELRVAGVKRIEAISAQLSIRSRAFLFVGCFLVAYVYGLDGTLRYTYQGYATEEFEVHSLLATIGVVRNVIGRAAQPTAAKVADVFGRLELLLVSIALYVIGTIIEVTAQNLETFCAGAVIYELGYTMAILLVEVIIADMSSLRNRLFFTFVPATPFLINTWVSGNIVARTLDTSTWRWGIGMFGIVYPAACILLLSVLVMAQIKARRSVALADYKSPFQAQGSRLFSSLFWQIDVIGILLIIVAAGFFLVPFTLARGNAESWQQAHIIAPVIIGILTFPVLFVWERRCKYPLIPFHLLKDRGVWAGFCVAMTLNAAFNMQSAYLFPMLRVAFDQTELSATRITSLYSFSSVITGVTLGLIVTKVRRLKGFIVMGCCLFATAFGILIRFRSGTTGQVGGVIAAEIVLGIGGGMFSYPTLVSVQSRTKHAHVAVVTGLYLASYRLGSALGQTLAGAVWTQRMPVELLNRIGNETIAQATYNAPYATIELYPIGTPERVGMVESYAAVQRILAIIGICLCIPLICWSLLLRDALLGNTQSLENAEEQSEINETGWKRWWR